MQVPEVCYRVRNEPDRIGGFVDRHNRVGVVRSVAPVLRQRKRTAHRSIGRPSRRCRQRAFGRYSAGRFRLQARLRRESIPCSRPGFHNVSLAQVWAHSAGVDVSLDPRRRLQIFSCHVGARGRCPCRRRVSWYRTDTLGHVNEPRTTDPAVSGVPLPRSTAEELAQTLRAVADPTRLQLLSLILGAEEGRATVGQLAEVLGVSQPTVTHHVKILVEDGLLMREREKKYIWLSVASERRAALEDLLR